MQIAASDFKARCLALLDEVARTGQRIQITKRGKLLAELVPASADNAGFPQHSLLGTVQVLGDIVEPAVPEDLWESNQRST